MKTTNKRSTFFGFAVTAMMLAASMVMGCKQPSVTVTAYPVSFSAVGGTVTASVDGKAIKNGDLIGVGKEVTFTAHPQSGMQVARWTGIENAGDKGTVSLTVKAGVSVTAECTAIMHTVTFAQPEHGKLTASIDGKDFTGGAVAEGKTVLFKAEPDKGYAVKQWTGAGKEGGTDKTVALTVEKTSAVSVEFIDEESLVEKYTVSFTGTLEKGTLSAKVDGEAFTGGTVQKGKTVVFTAVPADGYRVKKWTGTDNPASTDKTAVLTVKENATVSVEFESTGTQTFKVSFSAGDNGTLKAMVDNKEITSGSPVEKGKTVVFIPTAAEHYTISGWTLDGTAVNGTASVYILTVTKPAKVKVHFAAGSAAVPQFPILFVNPAHGTLTAKKADANFISGTHVQKDESLTFTITPEHGYEVAQWTVTGAAVAGNVTNTYTHTVTASAMVGVTLKKKTYKVTFEAEEGTPPPAEQDVLYQNKAAEPSPQPAKAGHSLAGWYNRKDNARWNFATGTVTEDTTLYAKWHYPVTFKIEGEKGSLNAKADGIPETTASPIAVEPGTTVEFTAVPADGYEVDRWIVNGIDVLGHTAETYSCPITAQTQVTVHFKVSDKTYVVAGVSFTMKAIAAVTNGAVKQDGSGLYPHHLVSLSAYLIGETEITQELWKKVMGSNPSTHKASLQNPVHNLSWFNCIGFCNELTKNIPDLGEPQCVYYSDADFTTVYTKEDADNKKLPYAKWSAKGFRLPTCIEWEWAANGGTKSLWAGTNDQTQLKNYAWYHNDDGGDSDGRVHEVKKKRANGYGLYDMTGNIQEFCWDWSWNNLPFPLPKDYAGPDSGGSRRECGGCIYDSPHQMHNNGTRSTSPDSLYQGNGLRVVRRP